MQGYTVIHKDLIFWSFHIFIGGSYKVYIARSTNRNSFVRHSLSIGNLWYLIIKLCH